MLGSKRFRRCATAVAVSCFLSEMSTTSLSALQTESVVQGTTTTIEFQPVNESVRRVLQRSSTATVIVTADESAMNNDRVEEILEQMTYIGESLFRGRLSETTIDDLAESGVALVDLDATVRLPVDPRVSTPATTRPTWQPAGLWDADVTIPDTDTRLVSTQQQLGIDGTGSVVVVMDSGVDSNASGLGGQVIHREDFSTLASSCTDRGFLDPYGHGTHVASIIAGKPGNFTSSNMRGIAPGAKIIDVRVFNCAGETTNSQIVNGIDWIISNKSTFGIDAVNMSIGSSGMGQTGQDGMSIAVNRMVASGIFVSVAAGNDGETPGTINSPGVAQFATTVGAASVSKYGSYQAFFSSTGPTGDGRAGIDFLAPGSGIIAAQTTAINPAGGGTVHAGTSMAAPYVAGIAALLAQQHPNEAPAGTTCVIGAGCPIGVVAASMTNPIQDRMKASDWYTNGIDNMSGNGLISASASILDETPAAAKSLSGTLRADAPNTIRIPPHAGNAIVSIYTPTSVSADMWDFERLHLQIINRNYVSTPPEVPCTKFASNVCGSGSGSWTPQLFVYLLRPSRAKTVLQISSPKSLVFHMTFTGLETFPTFVSRATSTHVDLSSSTTGTITISRVVASADPTLFTVTAPSAISVTAAVTLPAGAAGTSVSLPVERSGPIRYSEEIVVLSGDDGSLLASRLLMRTIGNGRIMYPNAAGFGDKSNWADDFFFADDGTIVLNSNATGIHGLNGSFNTSGIGIVPAGSLLLQKVNLVQTTAAGLYVKAIAADGSAFVGYQFPRGRGLLPGDDDERENYFVYKVSDGALTEIGPDIRPFNTLWLPNSSYQMNNDGSEVVWAVKFPSGEEPVRLGWQGGWNFATTRILATFPAATVLRTIAFRGGHIIVSVQENESGPREFRDYDSNGEYRVINSGVSNSGSGPGDLSISADGTAVLFIRGDNTVACLDDGVQVPFDNAYARAVGFFHGIISFVANDCSSSVVNWSAVRVYPVGVNGSRFIKMFANGTMIELDSSQSVTPLGFRTNASGTHFLRWTPHQLEPGDTNGEWDFYRGLSGSSSSEVLGPWVGPIPGLPSHMNFPAFMWDSVPTTPATWTPPVPNWSPIAAAPKTITTIVVGRTKSSAALARLAKMKVLSISHISVKVSSASVKICRLTPSGIRLLKAGSCTVRIIVTTGQRSTVSKVVLIKSVRS